MSEDLFKRLDQHPELKKRVEKTLDIAENTSGECNTADEAELNVIKELRKLGQDIRERQGSCEILPSLPL
ncbi:hypothetical protein SCG7086_BN_00080 [Chlamydiales bacterium SCGC AG-110-P3]|nr:hypothetical protein SCG7086_BN_00080 [Chlamydiales bacterium SCGC AG-110-P3]